MAKIIIFNFKIPNWNKYQKSNTKQFFYLSNDHIYDPAIQSLTHQEYRIWVTLLAIAARYSDAGNGSVSRQQLISQTRASGQPIERPLCKLSELGLLEIQIREEKRRKNIKKVLEDSEEKRLTAKYPDWFEELWLEWPCDANGLRGSKGNTFRNCKKFLKDHSLEKLLTCAERYLDHLDKKPTEYPYRLSNFFGQKGYWEEFIGDSVTKLPSLKVVSEPPPETFFQPNRKES